MNANEKLTRGMSPPVSPDAKAGRRPSSRRSSEGGRGGDIIFRVGKGWTPKEGDARRVDGSIIFLNADERELLRLEANGDIYVGGELTSNRADVVGALSAFVAALRTQ